MLAVALVMRIVLPVAKMELVNGMIAQKMTIVEAPAKTTDHCLMSVSWWLQCFGECLPSSESSVGDESHKIERIVEEQGVFSLCSSCSGHLKIWLKSLGVEIYPTPKNAIRSDEQGRKIQEGEFYRRRELVRSKYDPAIPVTDPREVFEHDDEAGGEKSETEEQWGSQSDGLPRLASQIWNETRIDRGFRGGKRR